VFLQNLATYKDDRVGSSNTSGDGVNALSGTPTTEKSMTDVSETKFTLRRIVHNRPEMEHFRAFLAENLAVNDLDCWLDIEALRRVPDHLRADRVDLVVGKYFNDEYFYGSASPANRHEQDKVALLFFFVVKIRPQSCNNAVFVH